MRMSIYVKRIFNIGWMAINLVRCATLELSEMANIERFSNISAVYICVFHCLNDNQESRQCPTCRFITQTKSMNPLSGQSYSYLFIAQ